MQRKWRAGGSGQRWGNMKNRSTVRGAPFPDAGRGSEQQGPCVVVWGQGCCRGPSGWPVLQLPRCSLPLSAAQHH